MFTIDPRGLRCASRGLIRHGLELDEDRQIAMPETGRSDGATQEGPEHVLAQTAATTTPSPPATGPTGLPKPRPLHDAQHGPLPGEEPLTDPPTEAPVKTMPAPGPDLGLIEWELTDGPR